MDNTKDVSNYSREECSEWLKNIGQCATGNVQELQIKIRKFMRYPRLVKRLEDKANKNYKFSCSLDPTDIPPTTAKWCKKDEDLPLINEDIFKYILLQNENIRLFRSVRKSCYRVEI